jgi:hypothetical protein
MRQEIWSIPIARPLRDRLACGRPIDFIESIATAIHNPHVHRRKLRQMPPRNETICPLLDQHRRAIAELT